MMELRNDGIFFIIPMLRHSGSKKLLFSKPPVL